MNNVLIFGDLHINKENLEECSIILDEIASLVIKHKVDFVIDTGDTFDNLSPSAEELDVFSHFIKKIDIPIFIVIARSHESTNSTTSIINHLGIINAKTAVGKEFIDRDKLYVGHFTLDESLLYYGSNVRKEDFSKYNWVVLGHQHLFQIIKPNICHIASSRFVDFSEAHERAKRVLIIENYEEKNAKCDFIVLKTPISMQDLILQKKETNLSVESTTIEDNSKQVIDSSEAKQDKSQAQKSSNKDIFMYSVKDLCKHLDITSERTKIRVICKDYELWREFMSVSQKYKDKFSLFKEKKDFVISINNQKDKIVETKDVEKILSKWLDDNKVEDNIKKILLENKNV